MSVKVMALVWAHYPGGGGELNLALSLADWSRDDGSGIWASVDVMADKSRLSERAVQYNLGKIKRCGWLILTQGPTRDRKTPTYRIPIERIPQGAVGRVQLLHPGIGVTPVAPQGCNLKQRGVTPIAPKPSLTINDPSVLGDKVAPGAYHPDFETAFKGYPQRSGNNPKRDAAKAWAARIREGVKPAAMIAGVTRYHAWCVGTDKIGTEYVMRASTFFGPSKPYEQGFPLSPDTVKPATRGEPRCIWFNEGEPPSTRCLEDGIGAPVAVIELEGHKVVLRMCGRHGKPPIKDKPGPLGRLVHPPEVKAAIVRFEQFAKANLVPA